MTEQIDFKIKTIKQHLKKIAVKESRKTSKIKIEEENIRAK